MTANGVNALDLISSVPATVESFTKAKMYLEQNFGTDIPAEKMAMLFDMIREDNWSEARLMATVKWFLKSKRFPSWTVADWFDYEVKLYPESWYKLQCQPGVDIRKKMDRYKLANGVIGYKWKDGVDLPLEKLPEV